MKKVIYMVIWICVSSMVGYMLFNTFFPRGAKDFNQMKKAYEGVYGGGPAPSQQAPPMPPISMTQADENFLNEVIEKRKRKVVVTLDNEIAKLEKETEEIKKGKFDKEASRGKGAAPMPHPGQSEGPSYGIPGGNPPMPQKREYIMPQLVGISIKTKTAILSYDGTILEVEEGGRVGNLKVTKVSASSITVRTPDKEERQIYPSLSSPRQTQPGGPQYGAAMLDRPLEPVDVRPGAIAAPAPAPSPAKRAY